MIEHKLRRRWTWAHRIAHDLHYCLLAGLMIGASVTSTRAVDLHAKPKKPAPKCEVTYEEATATGHDLVAKNPAAEFLDYSGDDAAKLLAALNARPPVTHWVADHILVVELAAPDDEDSPTMMMAGLVRGGCVVMSFKSDHTAWTALVAKTLGDRL